MLYLDVYLLENVLLNQILLLFALMLMGRRIRLGRLLMASLVGGILSVIPMLVQFTYGIGYILFVFLTGIAMIALAAGRIKISELLTGTLYFYMLSFVLKKLFDGLERILGKGYTAGIMAVTGLGAIIGYICYRKKKERLQTIYHVEIRLQDRQISLNALLDTGNALYEPISGKPVSILEQEAFDQICPHEIPEKCRVIPFHSIGKEHGLMKGVEVDELVIWINDKPQKLKQAVIAIYNGRLSQDGSYQMILHQRML